MAQAVFQFHTHLGFFLSPQKRQGSFVHPFDGTPSIKDVIEALGVPHTEVDRILVNGAAVEFSYLLHNGDHVEVLPPLESAPDGLARPPAELRFVLDVHLGRLAAYMRMLGFDTAYKRFCDDDELARISSTQTRILLTRDLGLLKRSIVQYGYYVREARNSQRQLSEVARRFNLLAQVVPFHRCLDCNDLLEAVAKEQIYDQLKPNTLNHFDEFHRCRGCGKIYWKGSHFEKMEKLIAEIQQEHEQYKQDGN